MIAHVLDNPAYNALLSGNKNLAYGNEQVKYFDKRVAPFVGLQENSPENFQLLHELLPHDGPAVVVTPVEIEVTTKKRPFWKYILIVLFFIFIYFFY